MNFLINALRNAPKVAKGAANVANRFVTGLRTQAPRVTTVVPKVSESIKPSLIQTLTKPRTILPKPTLPKPTFITSPAARILDDVAAGAKDKATALDEMLNLVKAKAPDQAKDAVKVYNAAKKGTVTTDEALQQVSSRASRIVDEVPNPAFDVAEEAIKRSEMLSRNLSRAGQAGIIGTALAPSAVELTGNEAPEWLQQAAAITGVLGGGALAARGAGGLLTRSKPVRDILKTLTGVGLGGVSLNQLANVGVPAAAEEIVTEETPIVVPDLTEEGVAVDPLQELLDQVNAAAAAEIAAIDESVNGALADLIAAYGGEAAFQDALAADDQLLNMELAAIEADANAARSQIAANYDAAIGQIEGYSTQATEALQQAAGEQQAAYEAAAGGLETAQMPAGMGAAEAAAAGVSGTAVGGAGVTGAALARSQAAAARSQGAAERAAVVTSLADQAATGRLNEADVMAALDRGIIDAQQAARIDSANRKSAARQARDQRKIEIAGIKYQATVDAAAKKAAVESNRLEKELALKQLYAQLSPEQRAAYTGQQSGTTPKTPSWLVEKTGDLNANVGAKGKAQVTLRDRNNLVGYIAAYGQDPQATNSSTALQYWTAAFQDLMKSNPAAQLQLESLGLPSTPAQLAKAFTTTK